MFGEGFRGLESGDARHLVDGVADVLHADLVAFGDGRRQPCCACEQLEAAREPTAGTGQHLGPGCRQNGRTEADLAQSRVEVFGEPCRGPGQEPEVAAESGVQGPLMAQAQGGQQVLIADEDEGEQGALGQVETEQEPDLLQGRGRVVLRLVEDEDQGAAFEFGQGLFDAGQVGLAPEARSLAEALDQAGQHAGATEGGVGQRQREMDAVVETAHPAADEGGLADTIGASE